MKSRNKNLVSTQQTTVIHQSKKTYSRKNLVIDDEECNGTHPLCGTDWCPCLDELVSEDDIMKVLGEDNG